MKAIKNLWGLIKKVRVWGLTGIIDYIKRNLAFMIGRRRLMRLHLQSKRPIPTRGITVIGDLTGQLALSKTLRDFVLSLKDCGIPVQTFDTRLKSEIPAEDAVKVLTPKADFDLHKYTHIVMMYRSPLTKEMAKGHTVARIAFHDSEHGIHEAMPFLRDSGDAIIGMSDFNYDYFKRAFQNQAVYKITYPFRPKLKEAVDKGAGGDFTVFFNFDFGSYYRKNIPASLKSFALAFKGVPNTRLVFKSKGAKKNRRQVVEMEALVKELGISAQFTHIAGYLPRAELDGLTASIDVYLSLHKSEGFGLGMAEAMSQGKPVVATNWSANTEFCRPDTAWCVPYKLVPILPHEYPPCMKEWAEADVEAAAECLRDIKGHPEAAMAKAARGKALMADLYSLERFKADVDAFLDGKDR